MGTLRSKVESRSSAGNKAESCQRFEVRIPGYRSSAEEWKRAQRAPASELPKLDDAQKEVARKFGMSDEQYARGVLAGQLGNQRLRQRAQELGEYAAKVLGELKSGFEVGSVEWEGTKLRWLIRVQKAKDLYGIPVSFEVVDDAFDSWVLQSRERLREAILQGVGYSAKHSRRSAR